MKLYTRTGDHGTTALLGGERVAKDDPLIEANGAIDEAQAFLGAARAECADDPSLREQLARLEADLWVVMGELALGEKASAALRASMPTTTPEMIAALEAQIDAATAPLDLESAFAVPGENRLSAALDVARVVVRRAERLVVALKRADSLAGAYLNRLSDLCWTLARAAELEHPTIGRAHRAGAPPARPLATGSSDLGRASTTTKKE